MTTKEKRPKQAQLTHADWLPIVVPVGSIRALLRSRNITPRRAADIAGLKGSMSLYRFLQVGAGYTNHTARRLRAAFPGELTAAGMDTECSRSEKLLALRAGAGS